MPKFRVTIEETAFYQCEVTARWPSEAKRKAEALFLGKNGIQIGAPFSCTVPDRYVDAEKIK